MRLLPIKQSRGMLSYGITIRITPNHTPLTNLLH